MPYKPGEVLQHMPGYAPSYRPVSWGKFGAIWSPNHAISGHFAYFGVVQRSYPKMLKNKQKYPIYSLFAFNLHPLWGCGRRMSVCQSLSSSVENSIYQAPVNLSDSGQRPSRDRSLSYIGNPCEQYLYRLSGYRSNPAQGLDGFRLAGEWPSSTLDDG